MRGNALSSQLVKLAHPAPYDEQKNKSRARVLPTIMSGLATGLLTGGVHKAISGNGAVGDVLSTQT